MPTDDARRGVQVPAAATVAVPAQSVVRATKPQSEPAESASDTAAAQRSVSAGPATYASQDVIATLQVGIARAVNRIDDWLASLPANPVTDVLSGALLLVRRAFSIPTIPQVSVDNVEVVESTPDSPRQAVFTVALGRAYDSEVTVSYATDASTGPDAATPGEDFTPVTGLLTFAPGETAKEVAVDVLADSSDENPETFELNVSTAFPLSENIELAGAEGAIVGAFWYDPFRLTITNQTGRPLAVQLCERDGQCREGQIANDDSWAAQADSVTGYLGTPERTFTATNKAFVGAVMIYPWAGERTISVLPSENNSDVELGEVSASWWERVLNWAGFLYLPQVTPWVQEAGYKSVEYKRYPSEPYKPVNWSLSTSVTVVEIIVR